MELLILMTVASMAILIRYIEIVIRKNGVPASVSDTYYSLEHPKVFTACIVSSALLVIPPALEASGETSQFLIFLSAIGMIMAGLFPHFRSCEKTLHYTGAGMLLACSQLWVACNCPWLLLLWVAYAVFLGKCVRETWNEKPVQWAVGLSKRHAMFWAEVTVAATVYLCILFNP